MSFRGQDTRGRQYQLLELTLDRLKNFETSSLERLSRVEESLRLLRQDLVGDGQPGRIPRLEIEVGHLRSESQRQRGVLAAISFIVSSTVAFLARWFHP